MLRTFGREHTEAVGLSSGARANWRLQPHEPPLQPHFSGWLRTHFSSWLRSVIAMGATLIDRSAGQLTKAATSGL